MSSKSPLDKLTLYLDRNLGSKTVPSILKAAGILCEIHDNILPQDAPDETWIRLCAERGWIGVTMDARLKFNELAKEAIKSSSVGIVTLTAKNITGKQQGELLVASYNLILKYAAKTKRPFLSRLAPRGHIIPVRL